MLIQDPQLITLLYVVLTLAWFKHKVTPRDSCCKICLLTFYSFLVPPHVLVESWTAGKHLYYVYFTPLGSLGSVGSLRCHEGPGKKRNSNQASRLMCVKLAQGIKIGIYMFVYVYR